MGGGWETVYCRGLQDRAALGPSVPDSSGQPHGGRKETFWGHCHGEKNKMNQLGHYNVCNIDGRSSSWFRTETLEADCPYLNLAVYQPSNPGQVA